MDITYICANDANTPQVEHMILYSALTHLEEKALNLAQSFGFTCSSCTPNDTEWFLQLTDQGLLLHTPINLHFTPFTIAFNHEHSRVKQFNKHEPLAKAINSGKSEKLTIIDATAGLGRDAFLLASLGHQVTMIERNPILAALLTDALEKTFIKNLSVVFADSAKYISTLTEKPDVIYIDPMFPEREKSARVKKEMQILQMLIGHETSENQVLAEALLQAKKRVVIKRPRHGAFLNDLAPDFQILSKTHRFDVFNCNKICENN